MNERKCGSKSATPSDKRNANEAPHLKPLSADVLKMFSDMRRDRLDLHVIFEARGNEPAGRMQVLDAVEELVREGFLESAGGDFYRLTDKGKEALARQENPST